MIDSQTPFKVTLSVLHPQGFYALMEHEGWRELSVYHPKQGKYLGNGLFRSDKERNAIIVMVPQTQRLLAGAYGNGLGPQAIKKIETIKEGELSVFGSEPVEIAHLGRQVKDALRELVRKECGLKGSTKDAYLTFGFGKPLAVAKRHASNWRSAF